MPSSAMNGERPSSPPRADTPVLTAGVWLFVVAAGLLMAAARPVHYLLFHTLAELIAISVAISVFTLTWATRQHLHNGYLVIVGAETSSARASWLIVQGPPNTSTDSALSRAADSPDCRSVARIPPTRWMAAELSSAATASPSTGRPCIASPLLLG
jgi:hypothetical protein